jgi:hypothetical protein
VPPKARVDRFSVAPGEVDPLFEAGGVLLSLSQVLLKACFEQNCSCANRRGIRPKKPRHISHCGLFGVAKSQVILRMPTALLATRMREGYSVYVTGVIPWLPTRRRNGLTGDTTRKPVGSGLAGVL